MATLHQKGVALWGGDSWKCLNRLAHQGARVIDFSPCEKFMVTWSSEPITVGDSEMTGPRSFTADDEGNRVAVWDVKTGHLLRTFPLEEESKDKKEGGFVWPFLKFSPDDKYCARIISGKAISIYELPSMEMLEKKSVKIDGVVDFEWVPISESESEFIELEEKANKGEKLSELEDKMLKKGLKKKRENNLVYWVPEIDNQPARVTVMNVPTRTVLRSKNLFNVSDVSVTERWRFLEGWMEGRVKKSFPLRKQRPDSFLRLSSLVFPSVQNSSSPSRRLRLRQSRQTHQD